MHLLVNKGLIASFEPAVHFPRFLQIGHLKEKPFVPSLDFVLVLKLAQFEPANIVKHLQSLAWNGLIQRKMLQITSLYAPVRNLA